MTRIGVAGCSLVDYLYGSVDFSSEPFRSVQSSRSGDGGLRPGGLVFASDLERFAGRSVTDVIEDIAGPVEPDTANIGGPAVVAAIHAAQVGAHDGIQVKFCGARGDDEAGHMLAERLSATPLDISAYRVFDGPSPSTIVLSDPSYGDGAGERCFINTIGTAAYLAPEHLPTTFYESDVVLFGGTALVPTLHDRLDDCLSRAREHGAVTVVGTVYDFRNEQRSPGRPWPLVAEESGWTYIDFLVTDREEALKISGTAEPNEAVDVFLDRGVGAVVVTQGADEVIAESRRGPFGASGRIRLPVSERVRAERRVNNGPFGSRVGDTTGCGDNFVGGLVHSLAPGADGDFRRSLAAAIVSGGVASFYLGGTYFESSPGEKAKLVESYLSDYLEQIGL